MELDWLNNIIDVLPDDSNYQKSFFDISGFPRWETVNSNLLAFYFNKDEEHNLNTLFIESLLMLLKKDSDINFYDNFEVFREYRTNQGNFIDIVIKSNPEEDLNAESESEEELENEDTDWAIIIENKIDAPLYNNLIDYWDSVNATQKIGIVLSKETQNLTEHNKDGIYYYSVTHKALIEQVQQNLFGYFSKSNEKHLILLKEYINNIENIYYSNIMDEQYSLILNKFFEHKEDIKALENIKTKLTKFVSEEVFDIFKQYGFNPYSNKATSKSKHFFPNKDTKERYRGLRFWVSLEHLIYNKEFKAFFELYNNANTKYGSRLKEILQNEGVYTNSVTKGTGGSDKGGYNHVYTINIPLNLSDESDLINELTTQLKNHFFEHKNDFLNKAVHALDQAKSEPI